MAPLIGFTIALLMVWLLLQSMRWIPEDRAGFTFLRAILGPFAVLLVVLFGYKPLLPVIAPMTGKIGKSVYNSLFATGLVSAAGWFTLAWIRNMQALVKFVEHWAGPRKDVNETVAHFGERTLSRPAGFKREPDGTIVMHKGDGRPRLGRYEIVKELGRGSMAVVYLGNDPTIHRSVAIKTVRLDQTDDPDHLKEVKERFFREAESTGRLSHPNIVTIYDAGEEGDLAYIAMELLQGTTLKNWCRKENILPVSRTMDIVATVAEALDYAHRQNIVHRDIKPANIMIAEDGTVKVMDFGIARITTSTKTQTCMILGTPSYMSPEQLSGDKVDGRTDIFSLGVVLFELLTSEKPFQADDMPALMFKIAHEPHPSILNIRPDLPPRFQSILDRALHKKLTHRYQTARELAQDLRGCLQSVSV